MDGDDCRAILIAGPKGCGKTASLLKLNSGVDGVYLDLTDSSTAMIKTFDDVVMENGLNQVYSKDF